MHKLPKAASKDTVLPRRSRFPIVANLFYPDDAAEVAARLYAYGLEKGKGGRAKAIIAPHGSWDISGMIAAGAFITAAGRTEGPDRVERVLMLGPIHGETEKGIFLSESDYFSTPLGSLAVDHLYSANLAALSPFFVVDDIPHLKEHSLEVLLPLVKYCFPQALIIPILLGGLGSEYISILADALGKVFGPLMNNTLCIVSCNLSVNPDPSLARIQAEEALKLLLNKDPRQFGTALSLKKVSSCGSALAASLLESGLVKDLEAKTCAAPFNGPMLSARGEENTVVYYGAISYQ
ncbi:MAG: AmmeMemoRadiSam system protein B [Treponema sp.]|jgi:AmmeMemoRadiSam system protein B|nr:AmmeMemoRadiSam system protein B [Treponema sp.]